MFQILIVDDERIILNGCRIMISEMLELPFPVDIKTAVNVPEAISILETSTPDMILTDIRMPVMDGFSLIEYIRNHEISSEIVILTSHADFEYARTALRYNVLDFILKPINEASLKDAILKIFQKQLIQKSEQMDANYLKVLTMLLYELSPSDLLLTEEMLTDLFPHTYFTVIVAEADNIPENLIPFENLLLQYYDQCRCYRLEERKQLICICNHNTFFVKPSNLNEKFYQLIGSNLLLGTSISSNSIHKLHHLYSNACQRIFYSKVFGSDENLSATALFSYQDCIRIFLENDAIQMRLALLDYIGKMNLVDHPSSAWLTQIYISYFSNVSLYLENSGVSLEPSIDFALTDAINTIDELIEQIIHYTQEFRHHLKDINTENQQLINQLLGFIKNHYREDISLDDLSTAVGLHPNYVCTFFKKTTGQSYLTCLHKERIAAAKKLLIDTDLTIEEIAGKIGYNSSTQFARIFRKYEGGSPSDFRSQ